MSEASTCVRSWVAEIERCPDCGKSAVEHTTVQVVGSHTADGRPTLTPMREITRPETPIRLPIVQIHTAGELHPAPEISGRVTFTLNLSDLLDDPAHKPHPWWVKLDGTDARVEDFVFATDGAQRLWWDAVRMIEAQMTRGKDVVLLILCRGGKHRSVAFGENFAEHFGVIATHHHKHLDRVVTEPGPSEISEAGLQAHLGMLADAGIDTPEQFVEKLGEITP